jgi:hypothetical protein
MTFEAWIALAFPWLEPHAPDYRNLRAAFDAGHAAALATPTRSRAGVCASSLSTSPACDGPGLFCELSGIAGRLPRSGLACGPVQRAAARRTATSWPGINRPALDPSPASARRSGSGLPPSGVLSCDVLPTLPGGAAKDNRDCVAGPIAPAIFAMVAERGQAPWNVLTGKDSCLRASNPARWSASVRQQLPPASRRGAFLGAA